MIRPAELRDRVRDLVARFVAKGEAGADVSEIEVLLGTVTDVWNEPRELQTVERLLSISTVLDDAGRRLDMLEAPRSSFAVETMAPASAGTGTGHSPAIAITGAEHGWLGWLEHDPGAGDALYVRRVCASGGDLATRRVQAASGGLLRPRIAAGGADAWLLWAERTGDTWRVAAQRLEEKWIESPEPVTEDGQNAFNQEAALDRLGNLHVACQVAGPSGFQISYQRRGRRGWLRPHRLSPPGGNHWDPVIAADERAVWVVWSTWIDGCYRLLMRRRPHRGSWEAVRAVPTAALGHAVHPDITVGVDGRLWLAFDELTIPGLSGSGPTAYRPAERIAGGGRPGPAPTRGTMRGVVRVLTFDGTVFSESAKTAPLREASATSASGYPKIGVDARGRTWLAWRVWRRLPFREYYTELAVSVLSGAAWAPHRIMANSDAPAVEASIAVAHDELLLAWHSDGRRARGASLVTGYGGFARRDRATLDHLGGVTWDADEGAGRVWTGRAFIDGEAGGASVAAIDSSPRSWALGGASEPVATRPLPGPRDIRRRRTDGRCLYWGDLHRHSNISRCFSGWEIDVEDHFRFAQDSAGFDFWAMTDHAEHTSEFNWDHLKKLASLYHVPGRFVPFVGFEWTSFRHGHLNVIYPGSDGPIFSATDRRTSTPTKLWRALAGRAALTIPHHPSHLVFPTDWSYWDDRYVRVVEIFQAATGSYESEWCVRQDARAVARGSFVEDALARGRRFGVIGSTDHRYGASYVGAYCGKLTREEVFLALQERRCFAATARGIEPYIAIGDARMGEEVADSGGLDTVIGGLGVRELSKVQLIEDGRVIAEVDGSGSDVVPIDIQLEAIAGGPRDWDGSLRIEGAATLIETAFVPPQVTSVSEREASWSLRLPRFLTHQTQPPAAICSLGFSLTGAESARLQVSAAGQTIEAPLGLLRDGHSLEHGFRGGAIRLRRGVGGLTGLRRRRVRHRVRDFQVTKGHWYYVRVIQVDGEMAWSSPIWVVADRADSVHRSPGRQHLLHLRAAFRRDTRSCF